jgi:hypothetical protein
MDLGTTPRAVDRGASALTTWLEQALAWRYAGWSRCRVAREICSRASELAGERLSGLLVLSISAHGRRSQRGAPWQSVGLPFPLRCTDTC